MSCYVSPGSVLSHKTGAENDEKEIQSSIKCGFDNILKGIKLHGSHINWVELNSRTEAAPSHLMSSSDEKSWRDKAREPEIGNMLPDWILASQKCRMLRSANGGAWLGDGTANWVSLAGTFLPLPRPWCEGYGSAFGAEAWKYKLLSNPFLARVFSACLLNGYWNG